jgi:type III secretion system YscQ/HrcQ family protein
VKVDDFPAIVSEPPTWREFYRSLAPEQAQLQQRFFQRAVRVTSTDHAWNITWSPVTVLPQRQERLYAISLLDPSTGLHLLLELPQLPEAQRIQLATQHHELPLAQAACCQILAPLLEALQTQAQAQFQAHIYYPPHTWPKPQGLPMHCHIAGHDGTHYSTGLGYWQHAEALPEAFFANARSPQASNPWLELPCLLQVECGHQYLTRAELQALEPGDAIFLADNQPGQTRLSLVILGYSVRWVGVLEQQGFHVQIKEPVMTQAKAELALPATTADLGADPSALDSVDSIPLTLSFSLGSCEKSFADIAQLQPGYILPLPPEFDQRQVAILANGKKIGLGELIVVGDRLAVQIDKWKV